jgi:hypothetical protein
MINPGKLIHTLTQLADNAMRASTICAKFGLTAKAQELVINESKTLEICTLTALSTEEVKFNLWLHASITETEFEFIAEVVKKYVLVYGEVPSWWMKPQMH